MTGPRRCVKKGPPRPIPAAPPVVEVLPRADSAAFIPPPELAIIGECFAAGDYRGCVEPLEVLFFARRNTLHQGVLQYVVGLLQLRGGLVRTPRRLFRQALELLAPYAERREGFDLQALRAHAEGLLSRLPEGLGQTTPEAAAAWWSAPPPLCPHPLETEGTEAAGHPPPPGASAG